MRKGASTDQTSISCTNLQFFINLAGPLLLFFCHYFSKLLILTKHLLYIDLMVVEIRSKFVTVDVTNACGSCQEELTNKIYVHFKSVNVPFFFLGCLKLIVSKYFSCLNPADFQMTDDRIAMILQWC